MFRAVFLDWFNTIARYEPPRRELHHRVLAEFGFDIDAERLISAIAHADKYFYNQNAVSPVEKRPPEEKAQVYLNYSRIMLAEIGLDLGNDLLMQIVQRGQALFQGTTFTLFDDVIPTLQGLKQRKLILGLLTNLNQDMQPICRQLNLEPYLDFVVTSEEAGADKPAPPVFLTALEKAGVEADQAIHIGDQYQQDVAGARGVGISPILIDRYGLYPEIHDCPRIRSLSEVADYL